MDAAGRMTNGGMMCGAGGVDHSLGSGSGSGSGLGSCGFVPAPGTISVNKKQIDMDWSDEEQAVLEHCLAKYAAYNTTNISLYARISLQLNNKTVRDVAMRCRWMAQREMAKKKKEDKKDINAASNSNIVSKPGFSPYASQRTATNNNNGSSIFFNATVQLLHHNSRVFDQISANLTSNQIQDNIVLLRYARNNLINILSELNEQQSFISRMPPLPVELDDELANSILAPASTCPSWK